MIGWIILVIVMEIKEKSYSFMEKKPTGESDSSQSDSEENKLESPGARNTYTLVYQ